jgi:hypothetical protein
MFDSEELRTAKNAAARLARLLSVVVAHADGRIDIPYRHFDQLPNDVKLIEHYDDDSDCIVLRTGVVKDEQKTAEPKPAQLTEPKAAPALVKTTRPLTLAERLDRYFPGYSDIDGDGRITLDGTIGPAELDVFIAVLQEIRETFDAKSS